MLEPPVTPIRKANDGLELPATGFGTYKVNGLAGVDAIKSAIHQGYRLIDSAFNYENEGVVGRAIRESGVPREDIIVTSKLPGRHHAHDEALLTIEESVCRMGLDYIDLYLIHWPNPSQGQFVEAWEALVEARERGLVKHIGVSNFLPGHIDLLIRDTGVTPAVNQVELHPYFQQRDVQAKDAELGIVTQAWSPLGGITFYPGWGSDDRRSTLDDPTIGANAKVRGKSPAQVMLRWHLQEGRQVIPKSVKPQRIAENLNVFDFRLTDDEIASIDGLDTGVRGGPDPRQVGKESFDFTIPEA